MKRIKDIPIKSIFIKEGMCLSHMLCEGEAPNVFFDDGISDSISIRKLDEREFDLEKDNIFSAAYCCPMAAIEIELENGKKT